MAARVRRRPGRWLWPALGLTLAGIGAIALVGGGAAWVSTVRR